MYICITIANTLRHMNHMLDPHLLITNPSDVTDMRKCLDFMSAGIQQQILMDLLQHPRARSCFTNILKDPPMPLNKLNRLCLARLREAMKGAMNANAIQNPYGIATCNGTPSGVQLASLPVEILDMTLDYNLNSLADFQAARQISRVFNRIVMQSKEFKRRLGKSHIMLDSDMTKKAIKLWQYSVWREITHTVVLEISRARPFYAAARPHRRNPLEDTSDTECIATIGRSAALIVRLFVFFAFRWAGNPRADFNRCVGRCHFNVVGRRTCIRELTLQVKQHVVV